MNWNCCLHWLAGTFLDQLASFSGYDCDLSSLQTPAETATPAPATAAKTATATPAAGAKTATATPTDADLLATVKGLLNGHTTQATPLKVANLDHQTFKAVIGPGLRFGKKGGMTKMISKVVFGVDGFQSLTDGMHANGVHAVIQANTAGKNQHLSLWRDP